MRILRPDWPAPAGVTAFVTLKPSLATDAELLSLLPPGSRICRLRQVHGTAVADAAGAERNIEADASVSRAPGHACLVQTADCLPLLLCSDAGDEVAAIHAGWRGLSAGIIEQTLSRLVCAPSGVLAWLGPAISQRHFEVGAEVRAGFAQAVPAHAREVVEDCFIPGAPGKFFADLYALARLRLEACGVSRVYGGNRCTYAEQEDFYSYRRDGEGTGRMVSVVYFS